jgi:DNA-directed RNA polymerase
VIRKNKDDEKFVVIGRSGIQAAGKDLGIPIIYMYIYQMIMNEIMSLLMVESIRI